MSRGPGKVMRAVERELANGEFDRQWTYRDLGQSVYLTERPTRAQLSSMTRAVDRLRSRGEVLEVLVEPNDGRARAVRRSDVAAKVMRILTRTPAGLTYDDLFWSIYPTTTPSTEQTTRFASACIRLCDDKHVRMRGSHVRLVSHIPNGTATIEDKAQLAAEITRLRKLAVDAEAALGRQPTPAAAARHRMEHKPWHAA